MQRRGKDPDHPEAMPQLRRRVTQVQVWGLVPSSNYNQKDHQVMRKQGVPKQLTQKSTPSSLAKPASPRCSRKAQDRGRETYQCKGNPQWESRPHPSQLARDSQALSWQDVLQPRPSPCAYLKPLPKLRQVSGTNLKNGPSFRPQCGRTSKRLNEPDPSRTMKADSKQQPKPSRIKNQIFQKFRNIWHAQQFVMWYFGTTINFSVLFLHVLPVFFVRASFSARDQSRKRMEPGRRQHPSAEASTCKAAGATPPKKAAQVWTQKKWSTYLGKLRKEVEAGEAPLELYLSGMEILNSLHGPTWNCRHPDKTEDQCQPLDNQRGTWSHAPSGPTNAEDRKTYVTHGLLNQWTTSQWKWLFGAALGIQHYAPWLQHIARQ